jgi:magnesium-protoporphyrin IX monomethyl ester (oxidative) cyclase
VAMQNTLLTPRFYTTDFDELDAIDVSPVREDWDKLIAQMKADPNKGHFKKNEDWDHIDWDGMEPGAQARVHRLPDLLLHRRVLGLRALQGDEAARQPTRTSPQLFQLMARDEARHAGFINDALREAGSR